MIKKLLSSTFAFCLTAAALAQPQPDVLYYNFDGTGTSVPNLASAPPAGTATATILGGLSMGPSGLCGGALTGSGNSSSTDYLNTGYATNLSGSWTISMYTKDITASSTLFYIFGDLSASSFRCFTNGLAGANNWILRGPITDVLVNGGATVAPHVTTFVYDAVAGSIYAYLDGVLVNTVAQTPFTIAGTGPFKVMGYSTNVGAPSGGKLDEFRMYSRALSAAEVAELQYVAQRDTVTTNACSSYFSPAGNTYTVSGTYSDTLSSVTGCDSIITTNLTVLQPSSSSISPSVCNSYTAPSGATYMVSGTYNDTIPNVAGCDSIISIDLTVLSSSSATVTASSCMQFMAPSGTTFTVSGIYNDTIPNLAGCDSIITINLTIDSINLNVNQSGIVLTSAESGAAYQWVDCSAHMPVGGETSQSFTATVNGSYAVIVTKNSCMDTSSCFSINTVGVKDAGAGMQVTLYPQPTGGNFTVDLGLIYKNVSVTIMDSKGSIVHSQTASNVRRIPVEFSASAGLYFVQVTAGARSTVLKIVKE